VILKKEQLTTGGRINSMKMLEARTVWKPILASAVCFAVAGNPITFAPASLFVIPVTQEFGWTRSQFFAGLSLATMLAAVIVPFVGRIVDERGARKVILPGILAFGVIVAALSQLNGSWLQYLAIMMFLGVAVMMHGPLPYTRVVVEAAGPRRGLALAIALTGSTVGLIAVPPLCSTLIASFGWRITETILGALVIAVALPPALLFIGRCSKGAMAEASEPMPAAMPAFPWRELGEPVFWVLATALLLNAIAVNAFLGHIAAIAIDRGLPISVGAVAVSMSGVGSAVGRLASGYMLDRIKSPQVGQLWFMLALGGLLIAAFGTGPGSVILAAALIGATLGAESELIAYLTSRFYPRRLYGRMYGLLFPFFMAGVSLGPLAFAMLFDAAGSYRPGFLVMAVAQLLGCLLLTRVGPYRYHLNGEPIESPGTTTVLTAATQIQS
jgi:MFS family permease